MCNYVYFERICDTWLKICVPEDKQFEKFENFLNIVDSIKEEEEISLSIK